jgi:hypothetical protein
MARLSLSRTEPLIVVSFPWRKEKIIFEAMLAGGEFITTALKPI